MLDILRLVGQACLLYALLWPLDTRGQSSEGECQDLLKICQALKQNFTLTQLTLMFVQEAKEWQWQNEGTSDLERCAVKESDSVNLIRARERKPYVTIKILIIPVYCMHFRTC